MKSLAVKEQKTIQNAIGKLYVKNTPGLDGQRSNRNSTAFFETTLQNFPTQFSTHKNLPEIT